MHYISPTANPFVRHDRWGRRHFMRRVIWGVCGVGLGYLAGQFAPAPITATDASMTPPSAYVANLPQVELPPVALRLDAQIDEPSGYPPGALR